MPVEPDERTYNIDPARIEAAITPRTPALLPGGFLPDGFPLAARNADEVLSLPMGPQLTPSDRARVLERLVSAVGRLSAA